MKNTLFSLFASLMLMIIVMSGGMAQANAAPNIKVSVVTGETLIHKPIYLVGAPIKLAVTLENLEGDIITTLEGFSDEPFYLYVRFTDEGDPSTDEDDINFLAADLFTPGHFHGLGPPGLKGDAEILTSGWITSITVDNIIDYFPALRNRPGRYTVQAVIPMQTFSTPPFDPLGWLDADEDGVIDADEIPEGELKVRLVDDLLSDDPLTSLPFGINRVTDHDNDGYFYPVPYGVNTVADCDDKKASVNPGIPADADSDGVEDGIFRGNGIDDDCDANTLDVVPVVPGTIDVNAVQHTAGRGGRHGSNDDDGNSGGRGRHMEPINDMIFRVFDATEPCIPINKGDGDSRGRGGRHGSNDDDSSGSRNWWRHNLESIWINTEKCNAEAYGFTAAGTVSLDVPPGKYIVIGKYEPDTFFGKIVKVREGQTTHVHVRIKENKKGKVKVKVKVEKKKKK